MPTVSSWFVFERDIFDGFDQSLKGSLLRHEADLFRRKFVVDLLDVKL